MPQPCLHVLPYRRSSAMCTCQNCHLETRLWPGPGSRTACWVIVAGWWWSGVMTVGPSSSQSGPVGVDSWDIKYYRASFIFYFFLFSSSSLAFWSVCGRFILMIIFIVDLTEGYFHNSSFGQTNHHRLPKRCLRIASVQQTVPDNMTLYLLSYSGWRRKAAKTHI